MKDSVGKGARICKAADASWTHCIFNGNQGRVLADENLRKDGKAIEIGFVYNDGSAVKEAIMPILIENFKKLGIKFNPQKDPNSDLFSKYVIPGNFDMTMFT